MKLNIFFLEGDDSVAAERALLVGTDDPDAPIAARVVVDCGWGERLRIDVAQSQECVCFQAVRTAGVHAYIGYGARLFIVNVVTDEVAIHEMDQYFCDLYDASDLDTTADDFCMWASSSSALYAFGAAGTLLWKAEHLGLDGVIAHAATETHIRGSGEWDPPDGWEPFIVDRLTGERISVGTHSHP